MEPFSTWPAYPMQFFSAGHNPTDATTYFFGAIPAAPTTTASAPFRVYFPRSGRIRKLALLTLVAGTLGSSETGSAWLRVNDTTDYEISTALLWNAILQSTGVAFEDDAAPSIEINDFFEIKFTTPTWATNPTSVVYSGSLWIEA